MGEYQITPAGLLVARETAFHERRVCRFAVLEVTKSPATVAAYLVESLTINSMLFCEPGTKDWGWPKTLSFCSDGT